LAYRTSAKKGLDVHTQITRDENYHDDNADDVKDHCFYSGYARAATAFRARSGLFRARAALTVVNQ
jgi:hypothetical protein